MFIIGITGGTGAGKTSALRVLRRLGALVIDCDALYHELLAENAGLQSELESRFNGVLRDGAIDRKLLGEIVFNDAAALTELNGITHKYIGAEIERRLAEWEQQGGAVAAIDAIALIEGGRSKKCDAVVGVIAPEDNRIARIMRRDKLTREQAETRIRAQKPEGFYRENCGYILENACGTPGEFEKKCKEFFMELIGEKRMPEKDELLYTKKNTYDTISAEEESIAQEYCEEYKQFLDNAKTEREAVAQAVKLASAKGFVPYKRGEALKKGAKVYAEFGAKALILAVIGKKPLSSGVNIAAAHIDSPRLDLKQVPLYEDGELAFFKTHYYGGIKKYQWVTLPMALHGTVIKKDGKAVEVKIGDDEGDPVFMITDLLPHLGKDQEKKTVADVFTGENLNILIGSKPSVENKDKEKEKDKGKERVKLTAMNILNEKFGIVEEDFLSAELEAVPLMRARDVGLDRSMIGAYGHDDRSCAFAALKAILGLDKPEKTAICILADKEEVGSDGVSGMQSAMFEDFMEDLCDAAGVRARDCFRASFCLSADVCNAFDPNFADVSEKLNCAKLGCGIGVMKFTGSRGKSGSSDASAEVVAMLRSVFAENGVAWQMAELGKVDQGGGGTIAKFMANRGIATIDAGIPVLSMHAPYEIVSKLDCYMAYKGILAVYGNRE